MSQPPPHRNYEILQSACLAQAYTSFESGLMAAADDAKDDDNTCCFFAILSPFTSFAADTDDGGYSTGKVFKGATVVLAGMCITISFFSSTLSPPNFLSGSLLSGSIYLFFSVREGKPSKDFWPGGIQPVRIFVASPGMVDASPWMAIIPLPPRHITGGFFVWGYMHMTEANIPIKDPSHLIVQVVS